MNESISDEATSSKLVSSIDSRIHVSVDQICSKLDLDHFVRSRCFELADYLKQDSNNSKQSQNISESIANAIACALVSIAHREAWQMHRVSRYLPDRNIGKLFGMSSSAVVYNRHLISSVISKKKIKEQKNIPNKIRTLR
jgi:hypothetical protein